MNTKPKTPSAMPVGYLDITPPACDLFASAAEVRNTPPVLLLNENASTARLLGFVRGRCSELLTLASLAVCGNSAEDELRTVLSSIFDGLDTVVVGLDCLSRRLAAASGDSLSNGGEFAA